MKVKVKTDVSSEPLSANDIKEYLNKKEAWASAESTELALMCKQARQLCEEFVGRSFALKTLQVWASEEEVRENSFYIELPGWPISSITSVTPYDSTGTAQTALTEGTGFFVEGIAGMNQDIRVTEVISTVGDTNELSDYLIEYVAGYGATNCESLPEIFKLAMKTLVVAWWGNRDNWVPVISEEIKALLLPYVETRF